MNHKFLLLSTLGITFSIILFGSFFTLRQLVQTPIQQQSAAGSVACPIQGTYSNGCFEIVRCERVGAGSGDEASCYRYVSYRCSNSNKTRLLASSSCRSKKQIYKDLENICGCPSNQIPTVTPIPVATPVTIPTPTISGLVVCRVGGICYWPCHLATDQNTCITQHNTCEWCEQNNKCINNSSVHLCDADGNSSEVRRYQTCD